MEKIIISLLAIGTLIYAIYAITRKTKVVYKEIPKEPEYYINYYPMTGKYAAVYKGEYIFKTVYGTWSLHPTPSTFNIFSTKKEAEEYLAEYLEWKGKDVVKLQANI
jgi:uncharacterized pyridoxamine 5'-phosphate oxidase family protein